MSARETGDLPRCALCGSLNGIIDRQVMLLSITRGPGHRELWSVMACERCAVAVVEKNTGDGAQVHAPLAASTPTTAPPPASPEPAREWTEEQDSAARAVAESAMRYERKMSSSLRETTQEIRSGTFDQAATLRSDRALWDAFVADVSVAARHFAPKVRVRLPEGVYIKRVDAAAVLRSAGVEIEGEAP